MPLIFKHLNLFIQKEFQLETFKSSFFIYRFICIVIFIIVQFHMIVNRHNYLYTNKNNNEQNILGYLETKNYTVYWSSNNNNDNELDNLTENLIYANSKLGKLFQQEVSFPKIKLKYFDNKSILEDELNSCKKNFFGSCSNILFGLYIVYNSNENKKNYTIYLFDKEKKENNYLLGNIKYSTMLTLLQKNMTKNNFNNIPYIFIYDVSKAESMSYNFIENSRQFLYMNYCYQLFSTIFIIASVNNIVKQRNGMLKKYLHDIGVSRFIFFGSCILRPLIEMIIFFCISGSILLSWWLPELNISLFNFTIWKILYSLGAMGFGVILTSLCDGKKDILITIIFWLMFIHLDIGEVVGLTSYNILSVLNINVIDNNLARLQTIPLYYDMKNKTKHFPLELNYKNEFFDTFEFQFIWLFMNMFFCYGFGIIVDNLWPNDSYNQFSFLYYIRLLRNYGYVRHILDKDDYHDLNKAIRSTDTKKKNTIKNEVTNNSKYKKKIIVGKHITKIYKATGETALEDVNFIFKSNEINVIIGFNESGLGTLMEILAGASKPSKGRVTYFNKSLKNFGRHKIGYCPHYTVTYTGMTVEMAIKVFSIIKNNEYRGLNNIKNEYLFMNYDVELLVETLGLTDYMDINCEHLPEKIQIYLNLCMAFVGNPRIIILNGILDKLPSEDVVKIISILKDMKEVKTIIVSTQDMEIADQLADHILLMKRGKVVDRGPFEELKKIHCSYAKLDIRLRRSLISDDGNLTTLYNTIHDFVKTFISEVVIEEGQSYGNHLVLKLPQDTKYNFGKLLDSLESNAETLNIIDYNINSFSLEDSFLLSNIGATLEPHLQKNIDLINRIPGFDDRVSGYTLYTKQLFALIKKRFSYMLIDIKTIFFVVIMTILLTTSLSQFFKNYSTNVCLLNENRTTFKQNYIPMYVSNKKEEDILDINNNIKKIGNSFIKLKKIPQNYKFWEEKFPLKISPNISNYQSIITTSLCLNFSLSFMDSLINFHSKTNNDNIKSNVIYLKKNFTINKEIDSNSALVMKFLTKKFDINWNIFIPTSQIIMMCIVTYFLTAYPLLIERIKGFKQQQYYSGVSPFLYWISNFIADIILGIIILSLLITLFGVLDVDSSFIPFFQATCIYFFMNLPVFYCLTFFGKNFIENCGLIGIFIITFQGLLYIFFGKNIITKQDHDEKNAKYLWEMLKTYMNPFVYLYNVKLAQQYGNENDKINASYFMNHGLGLFIGFLYIILIFGILILMECGVIVSIRNWIGRLKVLINNNNNPRNRRRRKDYEFTKTTTTEGSTDSNSANSDESCHVSTIRPEDKPTIILENAKPYLRDINLQMKLNADVFPGECFCWYIKDDKEREGIFNFITGNIKKKEGFITINDKNVNSHMRMGYSPSKNVLLPFFTPFEHYKLFALLSGFRKSKLQAINMLNLTGLIQYRHKQIQYCDLNQKRRLVVGISALTQSGAIFLDSPTEYLYKQGRIEIWELINSLLIEKDEAIIITTNNLEECNELSSRFGIIENGYIDYNGTYVGLKKKYCDGYNFKITVSNPSLEVLICLDQIMVREFEAIPADLTKITSLMEWDIPKITNEGKLLSWSDMYTFGEKLFLRYGKLVLPTQYSEKNSSKQNFNKFDLSTTDTASTTSEESRLLEEGFHDDEDDDDKADKVLGYGGIRSNITVPHIIDYIITNNSLDQVIFKIQNSNL